MRRLRAECAWKAGQTHRSLARYLLEETHETLEAIDTGDAGHLREELGDLLLQVYFHAVDRRGARRVHHRRRRRRHHRQDASPQPPRLRPGRRRSGRPAATPPTINEVWESIKAQEKQRTSVTDGLPPGLPALLYADKVLDRLARTATSGANHRHLAGDLAPRAGRGPEPAARSASGCWRSSPRRASAGVDPEQALRDAVRRRL